MICLDLVEYIHIWETINEIWFVVMIQLLYFTVTDTATDADTHLIHS